MQVKNTSRYPTEEVRRLVAFGMAGVATDDVAVNVKNTTRKAYGGRAYHGVPSISPVRAAFLITLHLGGPDRFPTTNLTETIRWLPRGTKAGDASTVAVDKGGRVVEQRVRDGRWRTWTRYGVVVRRPYGGRGSPLMELADWREALVAVAAHEAWHVEQFRTGSRRSEAACERFALAALLRLRADPKNARTAVG